MPELQHLNQAEELKSPSGLDNVTIAQPEKGSGLDAHNKPVGTEGVDQHIPEDITSNDNMESSSQETIASQKLTFAQKLDQYQTQLEHDFNEFDAELQHKPRDSGLSPVDWDELQREFEQELGEKIEEESEIMRGFESQLRQFMLWMQVSHERETERAVKRLKTQSIFVKNSESRLLEREQHYDKVMSAFQSAMRLLTQTP